MCLCVEIFGWFNTKSGTFRLFVFKITHMMAAVRIRAPKSIACFVGEPVVWLLFLRHGLLQ